MTWQPIETAPKGKSVLLYAGELCPLYCGKQRFGNLGEPQQDVHAWRCDSSGRFAAPTHWMPLPAAPGAPAVDESFEDRISDWAHGDALDAERYRWLRDEGRVNDFRVEQEKNGWMKTHSRSTLDAAIDAARAAKESP